MNYSALTRTHKPVHVTALVGVGDDVDVDVDVDVDDVAGTDGLPPPHAATKVAALKKSAQFLIIFDLFISTYLSKT
jgi:hypothetical protein